MVNFGDALRKGLRFGIEPMRWLPLFVLDLAMALIFLGVLFYRADEFLLMSINNGAASSFPALSVISLFIGLGLLGTAWFIIRLWIMGSLIHHSSRPRDFDRGYIVSIQSLHKLVGVVALVSLISMMASFIPVAGFILAIFVSLAFFFMLQGVVLDELGIVSTLKASWAFFRKSPFDVFVCWLLISIVSALLILPFMIPFMVVFSGAIFSSLAAGSGGSPSLPAFMNSLEMGLPLLIGFGMIMIVGFVVSQAFSIKAQTEFYMQFRKKHPSVLKALSRKRGRFF